MGGRLFWFIGFFSWGQKIWLWFLLCVYVFWDGCGYQPSCLHGPLTAVPGVGGMTASGWCQAAGVTSMPKELWDYERDSCIKYSLTHFPSHGTHWLINLLNKWTLTYSLGRFTLSKRISHGALGGFVSTLWDEWRLASSSAARKSGFRDTSAIRPSCPT